MVGCGVIASAYTPADMCAHGVVLHTSILYFERTTSSESHAQTHQHF